MTFVDILFIERPQDSNFLEICKLAKKFGVKLWVDFDDNLFCLPDWNPGKPFFDDKLNQQCMEESMKLSDIITVATPAIKEAYSKYNNNIKVVPNAFNDYNFKMKYNLSDKNIIAWRGSTTHEGDIENYKNQIWSIAEKYRHSWKWTLFGNDLWFLYKNLPNNQVFGEMDVIRYFDKIKKINPSIYVVPLDFCKFNESKSNCGWLEMTYAGAVTLAPEMPEFKRPGIVNYKNSKEFEKNLEILMNDEKARKYNYKKSFDYIKSNLMLSNVNKKREAIIKTL